MFILALTATALAIDVSASYDHGKLTVSVVADSYYGGIRVDGVGTGRAVAPSYPSVTLDYELSDGQHRISVSNDVRGGGSTTIYVKDGKSTDAPAPTAKPSGDDTPKATEAPKPTAAPIEHSEHTPLKVEGVAPTCTQNGLTEGEVCAVGGETLTAQKVIPALGHRYAIVSRSNSSVTYQCIRCDKKLKADSKEAIADRYGNIILDESGNVLNYKAKANKNDAKIIVLTVNKPADTASVTLDISLIMQLIREDFDRVEIVNGNTDAVIDLYEISASWFLTDAPISSYIFTFASDGKIIVAAQAGDEVIETETYTNVTVK